MKADKYIIYIFLFLLVLPGGCKKPSEPDPVVPSGKVTFVFHHYCEGQAIDFDERKYVNEAGNEYMVNEIQYFISDVYLHSSNSNYLIGAWKGIHYVDTDISSTQEWKVFDNIPVSEYSGISFTFGINEEKNQSLIYTDPPESLMFWPQYLGGGYHYLKLNGKWLDTNGLERPYNFHLGIGQEYDAVSGEITGFIQNYFEVEVPGSGFSVTADKETIIHMVMHADRWFKSPHTYDHDEWGGDIMQKQEAMELACENGQDVFEVLGVGF